MEEYITLTGESTAEYNEKRSRFIATVRNVTSEEEATAFINEMKTKYWDARHNCYAYSLENGLKRFSDDGEPHGTAGKPILEVIDGSGVTDIAVVVTRYFGGVLLGTGGLVRAYTSATKDAIENADLVKMLPSVIYKTDCSYGEHDKLLRLISDNCGTVTDTRFTEKIELTYFFTVSKGEEFLGKLTEMFSARISAEEIARELKPQKIIEK